MKEIENARPHFTGPSFLAQILDGEPDFQAILDVPLAQSQEEKEIGDHYCSVIEKFFRTYVDAPQIERDAKIPDSVLEKLLDLGAFGMKLPKEYGGWGLSNTNYARVMMRMASWCNVLALTVSVPQGIGVGMPILYFGTEEQKKKFLPMFAKKYITAFALTEPLTGSDASNVQTRAVLNDEGTHFIVNGEKLWCTNGPIARYITLIALVPSRSLKRNGKTVLEPVRQNEKAEKMAHTAFILDTQTHGVTMRQRCEFQGCRGIENAYFTFENVLIPRENVIGAIGQGLKIALTILGNARNTSITSKVLGMAKQAWQPTLDRANERVTFGKAIGEHQTQTMRIGRMATMLFEMEAMCWLAWRMMDTKKFDIRIEAAVTKAFCAETTIKFLKESMVLFGGIGYETADSKHTRGEAAFPIEQLLRDSEMYRIGEGATDILRSYAAREGFDPHIKRAEKFLNATGRKKMREFLKLSLWYTRYYIQLWARKKTPFSDADENLRYVASRINFVEKKSRALARAVFWAMATRREAMRDDQGKHNRIAEILQSLFSITATTLYADYISSDRGKKNAWDLANYCFHDIEKKCFTGSPPLIRGIVMNHDDVLLAKIGKNALDGKYHWLNDGIIQRALKDYT